MLELEHEIEVKRQKLQEVRLVRKVMEPVYDAMQEANILLDDRLRCLQRIDRKRKAGVYTPSSIFFTRLDRQLIEEELPLFEDAVAEPMTQT